MSHLSQNHALGSATEVLLAGGSAGGLSTFLHADRIRTTYFAPHVKFAAAPVSGFFLRHLPYPPNHVPPNESYPAAMHNVVKMQNATGALNKACVAAAATTPSGAWRCIFAAESYAYTRTRMFVINSAVDAYQMSSILMIPPVCRAKDVVPQFANCSAQQVSALRAYQESFLHDLTASETFSRPGNGGFIESCLEHVAAQ
eukprot:UC1_evm1s533